MIRRLAQRSHQVIVLASITGAITGLLVAGIVRLTEHVVLHRTASWSPAVLAVLPLCGLIASWAARRAAGRDVTSATADEYIRAFHDRSRRLGLRALAGRLVAAVATVGSGAPMGLEGPSVYAGATIGATLRDRFPRFSRPRDHRTTMVAGAAAGVAAVFKAPATCAVFALEVPYQDDLARHMLLPALIGSASGYVVFAAIDGTDQLFDVSGGTGFRFVDLLGAAIIGLAGGLGARAFSAMIMFAKRTAATRHPLRLTIACGVGLAGLFAAGRAITGTSLVFGSGHQVVEWVTEPGHAIGAMIALLVLRSLATSLAVAGGGAGGLFVPLVASGALVGALVGEAIDRVGLTSRTDHTLFLVIGVAAFLGAGYRVPLSAVMFVAETTGRPAFVVPGLIAAVVAELLVGRASVTAYQVTADVVGGGVDAGRAPVGE